MKTSSLSLAKPQQSAREEFYDAMEKQGNEEAELNDILAINWQPVYRSHAKPHSASSPNDVIIALIVKRKTAKNAATKQLSVRIGKEVARKMNINDGDYLALFYDDKNPNNMMIVKNEKGYVCRDENINGVKSNFMRVNFRANWLDNDTPFKGLHVKHTINQGRLILRANIE